MLNETGKTVHLLQKKFQSVFRFTQPLFFSHGLLNCNLHFPCRSITLFDVWTDNFVLMPVINPFQDESYFSMWSNHEKISAGICSLGSTAAVTSMQCFAWVKSVWGWLYSGCYFSALSTDTGGSTCLPVSYCGVMCGYHGFSHAWCPSHIWTVLWKEMHILVLTIHPQLSSRLSITKILLIVMSECTALLSWNSVYRSAFVCAPWMQGLLCLFWSL